jgi:enamine deaminase RidA (YjgF/YER057c/UK114 family)
LLRRLFVQGNRGELDPSHVLGTVCFGSAIDFDTGHSAPMLRLPLDMLDYDRPCLDLWFGAGASSVRRFGVVEVASDGNLLFGCAQVDERSAGGLRAAARQAYAAIFAALDEGPCAHPLRFWNYVPHINQPFDGLERYRHFNVGRQEAFLAARRAAFAGAPAACAIGTEATGLTVYFVAAKEPPIPIENPRQVSAYHYPAEYGPRSPTFSRASLALIDQPGLFISGTASIVGHRSEHPGDPAAQTRETFANLRAVLEAANAKLPARAFALERLLYTVYVRHAADFENVRQQFVAEVGAQSYAVRNAIFLRADICRAELLVEIEATGSAD